MRILFVIPSLYGGGAERVVVNLCNGLCVNNETYLHTAFENKGNKYVDLLSSKVNRINSAKITVKSIRSAIVKYQPDIVLSTLPVADIRVAVASCLLPRALRKKTVFVKRDATILLKKALHGDLKSKVLHWLSKHSYRWFDFYVANSNDTKESILQYTNTQKDRIKVIGNPVIEVIPQENLSSQAPSPFGFPYILAVGRLVIQKRFNLLIDAFNLLKDHHDVHLVILGEGPLEKELNQQVETLGLSDKVHLVGFKKETSKYYEHAKCYVMSSSIEGFGNVLIEALFHGVPVVSTMCKGGPIDILSNGEFGIITKASSFDLAEGISSVLDNKRTFSKEKLRNRALDYTVTNISQEYLSFFKNCVEVKSAK